MLLHFHIFLRETGELTVLCDLSVKLLLHNLIFGLLFVRGDNLGYSDYYNAIWSNASFIFV